VHDLKLKVPPGFPDGVQQMLQGMNQQFESMVPPLPAEPVGIGGKWRVVTRTASAGADLVQFATYTLKARNGSKATFQVNLVQLAAKDEIRPPNMPAELSARLSSFKSTGKGENELDMKHVAPDSGRVVVQSEMDLTVRQGSAGPAEQSSVATSVAVTFTRPKN
jgi:hypothetical protein